MTPMPIVFPERTFAMKTTTRFLASFLILAALIFVLLGCAAAHTSISKRNLDVQTRMTDAVFRDPVGPDKRTVFIQVRSTSDKPDFDLDGPIRNAISGRGYQVLEDPEAAHFKLQAQILSVSRASVTAADAALQAGYGAPVAGILASGTAGMATRGSSQNMAVAGVADAIGGGLVETVAKAAVQDVFYVAITDVRLSHKAAAGVTGQRDLQIDASQGIGGLETTTFSEVANEKRYRTRVISTANKWNLQYEEAAPELSAGLTRVLAGLF